MGTPYPLEKKNQILGRILSKEITVEQAHREYGIATSCVYRWLRQLKADSRSGGQGTQAIPLPQGMNFRAALVAEGYCQEVGFESPGPASSAAPRASPWTKSSASAPGLHSMTMMLYSQPVRVLASKNSSTR